MKFEMTTENTLIKDVCGSPSRSQGLQTIRRVVPRGNHGLFPNVLRMSWKYSSPAPLIAALSGMIGLIGQGVYMNQQLIIRSKITGHVQ
jgi:hypothetical protein